MGKNAYCHPTINFVYNYPFTITRGLINVIGYVTIVASPYQWVRIGYLQCYVSYVDPDYVATDHPLC